MNTCSRKEVGYHSDLGGQYYSLLYPSVHEWHRLQYSMTDGYG